MIFFGIPSVGQLKPSTLFGADDHFGFIQTLIGEEYDRGLVRSRCQIYYNKTNPRYWDQIITMINFLGIKKLDSNNRFCPIELLNYVAEQYDAGNHWPSSVLFDYLLCQWQYPHPIITTNTAINEEELDLYISHPRRFGISKPYILILSILKELYEIDPTEAYYTNKEFYWLAYTFYSNQGLFHTSNYPSELARSILNIRRNGIWNIYFTIRNAHVHLSYPKGFLKNSSVLTDDNAGYNAGDFFIGLRPDDLIITKIDSLLSASQSIFEFNRSTSARDIDLSYNFADYLYNPDTVNRWVREVSLYPEIDAIFAPQPSGLPRYDPGQSDRYNIDNQLKRLSILDRDTITRRRVEQNILRQYILRNRDFGRCAICNRNFPISFLTTAHIKKRSQCTDEEKRDLNIVMPACQLGCDKLFEDGYIIVRDGRIRDNSADRNRTEPIREYIEHIENTECNYFNESTRAYFAHHESENV